VVSRGSRADGASASLPRRALAWAGRVVTWTDEPAATRDGRGIFERTFRWPDRVASLSLLRLIVWLMVASVVYSGVLSDAFKVAEWMDDHQFYAWEESDRMTLLRWGQLPAWNPYWCGGTVGIAAPEDPFLGPDFLLRLIYGVSHGRRLAILLLVVMGMEGMYRLCRRLDATVMASAFAAIVFAFTDRFVGFIHDGWINFLGFELVPWVVLCFLRGLESMRWRLLGGVFLAWIVLSAGTYTAPFTVLTLGYLTVAFSARAAFAKAEAGHRRGWLTPWVVAATIGVVALALSFGKLAPTLAFMRQFPRVFTPVEVHGGAELFSVFWTKYAVVVALALVGLVTLDAAAALFFGGLLFFFTLAMGDFGGLSPFHLLKSLPMFGQLRFPDRYMVLVTFFAAVASARGISRMEDAVPALAVRVWNVVRAWRRKPASELPSELAWGLVALTAFLAYKGLRPALETLVEIVPIKPTTMYVQEGPRSYDQPFRQHRGNRRDAHVFPAANMGSLYCVAGNPVPESALLRGDLSAEEYPVDPKVATVKRLSWSPNEIVLEVDAHAATTIRVNQNWAPEWRTDVGQIKNDDKLLAVEVPAGKSVVTLAYRDRALLACLLVSLLSALALLGYFAREGVRWSIAMRDRWETMPTWPDESEEDADAEGEGNAEGEGEAGERGEGESEAEAEAEGEAAADPRAGGEGAGAGDASSADEGRGEKEKA